MLDLTAVIVIVGWMVSLSVALFVVPKLAAGRVCRNFGLMVVKDSKTGRSIYAVEGDDGAPFKVPIGVKKNAEGEDELVMGVTTLPMTLAFMISESAAMKVKMGLLNAKSQISRQLSKQGLAEAMQAGGSLEQMLPLLPKKAQMIVALAKTLGIGSQASNSGSGTTNAPPGVRRQGGAI